MSVKTLNLVLNTVCVANVKLVHAGKRSGSDLAVTDLHPATFLSQGRFPTPQLPEPAPRSRQEVTAMIWSMPPAGTPGVPPGSRSGTSAYVSEVRYPGLSTKPNWHGRDCQSPVQRRSQQSPTMKPRASVAWRTANLAPFAGK